MSNLSLDPKGLIASKSRKKRLLDFAVTHSPIIFYVADLYGDGRIRFISANVERITGHRIDSFLSDPEYGRRHIHPDDLKGYAQSISALKQNGCTRHEYRLATASGEYRWFRDELCLSTRGRREEFVGCMIDITTERQADHDLKEADALKSAVVEAVQDAIIVIDDSGLVVDFNAKAELMFGHRREKILGRRLSNLIIPKRFRSAHEAGLQRLRTTGTSHMLNKPMRFDALRGDGSEFPIELTVAQTTIHQRTIYVAEVRDISEKTNAEAEQKRLHQLIEDAVESLPNGFTLWDANNRLILANTAFARPFGLDPKNLRGMTRKEIVRVILPHVRAANGVPVDDTDDMAAYLAEQLGQINNQAMEIELADGQWRLVTVRPTSDGGQVGLSADITALKQKERALEESESYFRNLVEAHPLPVWIVEVDSGRILYESPAAAALMGREWKPEEEKFVLDHYAKSGDREKIIRAVKSKGELRNYEVQLKRADGSKIWVSATSRSLVTHGPDVTITGFVDLTDRRLREAELRLARETLEDAIESLSEGLVLYDADDCLVISNSRFRELNEPYGDLFVPGAKWVDVTRVRAEAGVFPDAIGRVEEYLEEKRSRRGQSKDDEFEFSDGRWIEMSHRRTRQGGMVHTWRDVTERRSMEQALRDSEDRVRKVLEACSVPITMNRVEDGVIIYENPAAQALMGGSEFRKGQTAITRWADPDDRQTYLRELRERGAVDNFEGQFHKADGKVFWGALSSRLIEYRGEQVVVSGILDLTERQAAEAELAHQREMLHQREKLSALGELLAGVSHELNNPLSVLVGQALMLREMAPDERTAARAEKIGKAADRCARIVKTFLTMARQEPTEATSINLNGVIESALEVTAYSLRVSGIGVTLRLARDLPAVKADPDQMRQVFTNLIINAQHALQEIDPPRKLSITSSYRKRSGQIVVKVKDNGPGIVPDIKSRIFEPLYTTKEVGAGTGMGLTLCHRIVEAHGGTIVLEGSPREGAVFAVRLPAEMKENESAETVLPKVDKTRGHRILVVDDDEDVGQVISDILAHDGHAVDVVGSAVLALERLKRRQYDIVLSDIRMPGMDGRQFYRALSDMKPELISGLAFITGDTLSPRVMEFLDATERPYLEKPIIPRDIRELIDLLMRRKAH